MMTRVEELWSKIRESVYRAINEAWHMTARDGMAFSDGGVLLFSAGKDSSLILAALFDITRDNPVDDLILTAHLGSFYITHIVVTGNSHPANTYCAASVMLPAEQASEALAETLATQPVMLARGEVFQAYAAKYGLVIGKRRWCYLIFKHNVLYNWLKERFESGHVFVVDGMSPSDRAHRRQTISDAVEWVETSDGYRFVAVHPLYGIELDGDEKLEMLKWLARRGEEALRTLDPRYHDYQVAKVWASLRCVVELYETYGDSMNCILCPYKNPRRLLRNVQADPALKLALAQFIEAALRGEHWQRYAKMLRSRPITDFT